jgi:hypothetical protein
VFEDQFLKIENQFFSNDMTAPRLICSSEKKDVVAWVVNNMQLIKGMR